MKAQLLLIDDSQTQSGQIKTALERLGYSVMHASSGAEGLKRGPSDVVYAWCA